MSGTPGTLHVVYAADARYAMPLAVAMSSAAFHACRRRALVFHVIQQGFDPALRERVARSLRLASHPQARIDWIDVPLERLSHLRLVHRYMSPLIYARLLIPDLLPPDVGRALYLDADTVVLDDLATLWDTPMAGRSLLAARDRIGSVGQPGGLANFRELGLAADAPYFNSGVLLIDVSRWRRLAVGPCVMDYLQTHRDLLRMGDQDGLNALLAGDWGELPFRWNWQIVPRMHRGGAMGCWAPEHDADRRSLVHFSTSEKPWLPGCEVDERHHFFEALDRTDWAHWRVPARHEAWVRTKRLLRRVQRRLGRHKPAVPPARQPG